MSTDAIVEGPLPTFKPGTEHVWRQTLEQDPPSPDPLALSLWETPDHRPRDAPSHGVQVHLLSGKQAQRWMALSLVTQQTSG